MITEYFLIAVFAVYAILFYAIERRLAKTQKVITDLINDFTRNISGQSTRTKRIEGADYGKRNG